MNPNEIHQIMTDRCWTRTQLAAQLGVNVHTVNSWMTGRRNPGKTARIVLDRLKKRPGA